MKMRAILAMLLAGWLGLTFAQQALEVISLRHRGAEQVLPALMPLLESGGTLSGTGNQLFLRASPRNRAEIRQALAAIDVPLRRLAIQVSRRHLADDSGRGASGGLALGTAGNGAVWSSRSARRDEGSQRVQTVDGGRAYIQAGQSIPIPLRQVIIGPGGAVLREIVVYRDLGHGFYVEPRLNGEQVTLEISVQADTGKRAERLSATVSGRLGEWMELGGTGRRAAGSDQQGGSSWSTAEVAESRGGIWLKVEELP